MPPQDLARDRAQKKAKKVRRRRKPKSYTSPRAIEHEDVKPTPKKSYTAPRVIEHEAERKREKRAKETPAPSFKAKEHAARRRRVRRRKRARRERETQRESMRTYLRRKSRPKTSPFTEKGKREFEEGAKERLKRRILGPDGRKEPEGTLRISDPEKYARSQGYRSFKDLAKATKEQKAQVGKGPIRLVEAPYHIARAAVEDPSVLKKTAEDVPEVLAGLPGAVVKTATDPKGAVKEMGEDISRRYGPLLKGKTKQYRERIKKEGALPEVLEAAAVGAPQSRILAAGAKKTKRGRRFMTGPRPKLRTTGGRAKPQELPRGAVGVAAKRALDVARRQKTRRRVKRAEKAEGRAGALERSVGPGEVLPLRQKAVQRKAVARRKGRGVRALKMEQAREVRGARRNIAKLSRAERRAFKYAMQLGLPADPKKAVAMLRRRREQIIEARRVEGKDVPKVLRRTNDELAVIDWLIKNADEAFTQRLATVVKEERSRGLRIGREDPGLTAKQRVLRRYGPLAEALGIERRGGELVSLAAEGLAATERATAKNLRGAEQKLAIAKREEVRIEGRAKAQATEAGRAKRRGVKFEKRRTDLTQAQGERLIKAQADRMAAAAEVRALRRKADESARARKQGEIRAPIESDVQFIKRAQAEAKKAGLERPAYVPSVKRLGLRYSDFALGGTKAIAKDKQYTGALFRTGREDVRPDAYLGGLAKNIKRKHNWNTVAQNFEAHTFDWGRNKTIGQLLDELDRRGIDPGTVAFWNAGRYRRTRGEHERADLPEEAFGEEPAAFGLDKAVDEAAVTGADIAVKGAEFRKTTGWSVIPAEVYREIHAETRPSGVGGRSWDVVMGKQSRLLLGTSPPWLAFQTASNAFLSFLGGTGPIDAIKAQVWWRKLSENERAAVLPVIGVGPHVFDVAQTKLGASVNHQLVNSYRAFKASPIGTKAGKLNPLDAMFRADNFQNNFFRKSMLYSQAKREAYTRMGKNVSMAQKFQDRTVGLFTLGPKEQIRRVLKDRDSLEKHAEHISNFLGDYVAYTTRERRILKRSVMFYGFLRHSTRFAFYTMPAKHPIVTAMLADLSRLQVDEIKELLGGDELPYAFGKIYFTKDGQLREVGLARMNPATNAIIEAVGNPDPLRRLIGLLPPVIQAGLDLAYQRGAFTGKTLKVGGETGYAATERAESGEGISLEDRARFALGRALKLILPYRAWEKAAYKGEGQSDTALAWSPKPTRYKSPEYQRLQEKNRRRFEKEGGALNAILDQMFPFLPKESRDPEIAESIRERRQGQAPAKKKESGSVWDQYRDGGKTTVRPKEKSSGSVWDQYR